jgi:hypothetical protein
LWPASTRFLSIGVPIIPTPMNPTNSNTPLNRLRRLTIYRSL